MVSFPPCCWHPELPALLPAPGLLFQLQIGLLVHFCILISTNTKSKEVRWRETASLGSERGVIKLYDEAVLIRYESKSWLKILMFSDTYTVLLFSCKMSEFVASWPPSFAISKQTSQNWASTSGSVYWYSAAQCTLCFEFSTSLANSTALFPDFSGHAASILNYIYIFLLHRQSTFMKRPIFQF